MDKCNCCGLNPRWICECGFLFCANHFNEHPSSHNKKQISTDLTKDEKEKLNNNINKSIKKYNKLTEKILNYKREFKSRIKVACKKTLEKIEKKKAKLCVLLAKRKYDELDQVKARKILQTTFKYKIAFKEGSKWIEKFFEQGFWEKKNSDPPVSSQNDIEANNPEPNYSIPNSSSQNPSINHNFEDFYYLDNFPQKRPYENSLHQKKLTEMYTVKNPKVIESPDLNNYKDRLNQNGYTRNVEPSNNSIPYQYFQEDNSSPDEIDDLGSDVHIKKEFM